MNRELLREAIASELEESGIDPIDFIRVILEEVAEEVYPGSDPEDLIDHYILRLSEE